MTTIVAALIVHGDERGGEFLICRRHPGQPMPLKWEFAGGKLEEGEDPAAGLRRELREELAIEAEIGPLVADLTYTYPERDPIRLLFFRVSEWRGEPRNLVFAEICWADRAKLPAFDFLAADRELVEEIARGGLI